MPLPLARDAQSSGDRVMAENYLQHCRALQSHHFCWLRRPLCRPEFPARSKRIDFDDEDGDERDEADVQGISEQQSNGDVVRNRSSTGSPAEVALNAESGAQEGERGQNRNDNRNNRDFRERNRDRNRNRNIGSGNGEYQRREFQPRDDSGKTGCSQDALSAPRADRDEEQAAGSARRRVRSVTVLAFVTGAQPPREEAPRHRTHAVPAVARREQSDSGEGDTANSAAARSGSGRRIAFQNGILRAAADESSPLFCAILRYRAISSISFL